MIELALVGTGGMMPLPNRFLTSLLLRVNGGMILTDCGEGTQISLKLLGWGFKSIDILCFTHFHADHISGLPGLLLTIGNSGRTEPLLCVGPRGLAEVLKGLLVIAPELPFPIHVREWQGQSDGLPPFDVQVGQLEIRAMEVHHRIPFYAYSFLLHRRGKFDLEKAHRYQVPMRAWSRLQKSDIVELDGVAYTSDMVLGPARQGLKVSYSTDTRPVKRLEEFVRGADLFIGEGLYGEPDKQEKTAEHMHMSYAEAAGIARAGGVKELWLTHFSPAMTDPMAFLSSATAVFPHTVVGKDRMTRTLYYEEE